MTAEHPFDRVLDALREFGAKVIIEKDGKARATCPTHNDRNPSLSITRSDRTVALDRHVGCAGGTIISALGLAWRDLFLDWVRTSRRREVAAYNYFDDNGTLVAQKVRYEPKAFRWRRPDGAGGWIYRLDDVRPGLYREQELLGQPARFLVEGEKAAERLGALGLPATCPPHGAPRWDQVWTYALTAEAAVITIFADNDWAGLQRTGDAAQSIHRHAPDVTVKVVRLPGLPPGGDVVDWLDQGHTQDELFAVVSNTPLWSPGA